MKVRLSVATKEWKFKNHDLYHPPIKWVRSIAGVYLHLPPSHGVFQ